MLLDKLSFINRTKLRIAQTVAPIKQASVTGFEQVDFELSQPKANAVLDFQLPKAKLSVDYSLPSITYHFYQANILQPATIEKNKMMELLSTTPIFENNISTFTYPQVRSAFTSFLTEPEIFDCTEYNELLNPHVRIENIEFRFIKPSIKGKNYVRKKETPQTNLFTGTDDEYSTTRTSKSKIERHYKEEDTFDDFDVFDLVFPALQPPLGNKFDNSLVLFKPLRPFQPDGIEFLVNNQSALLGDEMGLGKSVQTIIALRVLFRKGEISSCCIVCKKSMLRDWKNSFWDWAPELKVVLVEGGKDDRRRLWRTNSHIYICNYETLQKDLNETIELKHFRVSDNGHHIICPNRNCMREVYLPFSLHYDLGNCPFCKCSFYYPFGEDIAKTFFDVVVFDEIQETKNPSAKKTKAIRTLFAKYRWALTGTPLENKIDDLITICETIKPDIFKNVTIYTYQDIIDTYKPIFKRRRKEDVLKDLKPIESSYEWLELSQSQRRKYEIVEREGKMELEGKGDTVTVQHIFALITKLKQICNYDPESGESSKLEYLKEKLEGIYSQGDKALVFSQFPNKTLEPIMPLLKEYKPLYYHGQLSNSERESIVKKFQSDENTENAVMLLSLKSGNSGITLTKANYVFHFDLWWNPAISAQATARAHRIGQNKTVFETLLLSEDTIERRIYDILETKKGLFNLVVDDLSDIENIEKLFTSDELFGLFGLQKNNSQSRERTQNLSRNFHSLSPFEFEEFVGDLFSHMGYHSRVTKKSNDGGIDIYAKLQTPTGLQEIIIQCKHKEKQSSTVDVGKVRELFGVFSANRKLTKAFLVTNGKFTSGAITFANENGIELIDGVKLQGYVELHY